MMRDDECRLIIDPPASGAWNMAVDEALLDDAANRGIASLRFYQWSEPTLSLGYFQRHTDRQQHAASRACPAVRRQSGGGAILHDQELTYSLALPAEHPFARRREQPYTTVHRAVIAVLEPLIFRDGGGWSLRIHDVDSRLPPEDEPFLCFQRRARGDVVLTAQGGPTAAIAVGSSTTAVKIAGSAQRRRRGAILQHGSLLLDPSPHAPELPGFGGLTGIHVSPAMLARELGVKLSDALSMRMTAARLPDWWRVPVEESVQRKYGRPDWTTRR